MNLEKLAYKTIMVCLPNVDVEISSFEDLEDIGNDVPIFDCGRPFSGKETENMKIEKKLTKNDLINQVFVDEVFILVESNPFTDAISEFEDLLKE